MQNRVRVEARNITAGYGATAVLRGIDLVIEPGEFFALLGPSGSGKSTLLRLVAGFVQPRTGQLLIAGEDVARTPPWRRDVGMVFQNYALWPHMTVWQNVAFGLEERRLPRKAIARKVEAALALVNLAEYGARRPNQLSGGQQQRVALARTLAVEPKVLLLDEPLSNLDAKLREHMRAELRELQRALGITTIFVTHDQEEAMTTADRIAVMDQGLIQQVGTPMELFDYPANRFVAGFVGSINLLPGSVQGRSAAGVRVTSPVLGEIELPAGMRAPDLGAVEVGFRPHVVALKAPEQPRDPGHVWLQGRVADFEFLGEFVRYHLDVMQTRIVADRPHRSGQRFFAREHPVEVGIPRAEIRLIPQ